MFVKSFLIVREMVIAKVHLLGTVSTGFINTREDVDVQIYGYRLEQLINAVYRYLHQSG